MELQLSKINGTNQHLDYKVFEQSVISKLHPTCNEAELIILNKFPVAISPQSDIDFIVLLNIPNKKGNYYQVEINQNEKYNVANQIVAVMVFDEYADSQIDVQGNSIQIDDVIVGLDDIPDKIKWGLTNYLSNHCGMNRQYITVHPLLWIKSKTKTYIRDNIFIGEKLDYLKLEAVIKRNYYFKWQGYKDWLNSDILFNQQVKNIFEQASKDSVEGYLTKRKIDRIQRKLGIRQEEAFNSIGEKLVEIKGKAGTGKTADLLKFMLQKSLNGVRATFLTYNHLLVYDISSQIKSFSNRLPEDTNKAATTVNTIHGYFYNIAKKLGVLLLLTEERINELTTILDARLLTITCYLDWIREQDSKISFINLKRHVQTRWNVEEGVKREVINLIKYFTKVSNILQDKDRTEKLMASYKRDRIEKLRNIENSNVFLTDYHKILERIYQATTNLDNFLKELDVENKYSLLMNVMDLKEDILVKNKSGMVDSSKRIDYEKLKTRYRRGLSGFAAGRTVYVDEAQDCHPLERDIIFNLFGSENCVIANGDKEQLIRYSQLCNWHISQGNSIDMHGYLKPSKSFRMKPAIAALANHVAAWYGIDLNIEPMDTNDHGQIYISTTNKIENQVKAIEHFNKLGVRQGCTNYESVLLLKPGEGDEIKNDLQKPIKVNEYNNIVDDKRFISSEWDLIKQANNSIKEAFFWNATGNIDKRKMSHPGALSIRAIYYESCRGLEAWSVMCFGLDTFFEAKVKDDEADNFLLNEIIFDEDSPELKRRQMFAATWTLMALTRCIENSYIQLIDPNSSIYQCILDFYNNHKEYVTIVR